MDAVSRFAQLVDRPPEEVDLARAALTFAAAADPEVDPEVWLAELDRLADGVGSFADLRRRLFVEQRFVGAVEDYDAPANSFLHRVLERRMGLPITLSVVTMEVGRRAGVEVQGIGAPAHFLVRDAATGWLCDPYGGGVLLDEADVAARLLPAAGPGALPAAAVPIVDAHQILARMLANLVHSYRRRDDVDGLEWVLRCRSAVQGAEVESAVQLGELLASRGRFRDAALALHATAERVDDGEAATLHLGARSLLARLN
jgi:regulator of sirC expression with transglutaminase-like and TPR domain